jgi:curved DNA-binding protein CbpA
MTKKIEALDFYELLNLHLDASPKDIENAYLLAVATYHEESMASYGALSLKERRLVLEKIEEAFQTLRDPEKKKAYDLHLLPHRPEFQQRARLRRSTKKLEIEAVEEVVSLLARFKTAVGRLWRRRNGHEVSQDGKEILPRDFLYYGDILKKVRERRGLSREDIAVSCGLSPEDIEWLEKEDTPPLPVEEKLLEGLRLYAKCLELDPDNKKASRLSDRLTE